MLVYQRVTGMIIGFFNKSPSQPFPPGSTWAPTHNAATSRPLRSPHRHAPHTHGWDLWGCGAGVGPHNGHRRNPWWSTALSVGNQFLNLNQTSEKAMPEAPAQDEESDIAPVGMCLALRHYAKRLGPKVDRSTSLDAFGCRQWMNMAKSKICG